MSIDLHSHILAGVDDGPEDLAGSIAMAKAFSRVGTHRVVATPHVNRRWGLRLEEIAASHGRLVRRIKDEGIDLEVELGAEIALSSAEHLTDDDLASLRLGSGNWLLIEPPSQGVSLAIHAMYLELLSRGFSVVIAHPERCDAFRRDPECLATLVRSGMRCQLTAGSLAGDFGHEAKDAAILFLQRDLIHVVASDAHDTEHRRPGVGQQLSRSEYSHLDHWLTIDMPRWILDGGSEPPRPDSQGSRGFFSRLHGTISRR